MTGLIMAAQLLLAILIIAGVHEWGHMIAARLFGIRVEQFSIGFPPRIFSKKWKGTEYILGLLPLGGYVKLSGMIDESLDTAQMKEEPKPYEFRSKPAWQRLIVMLGGIIVNLFMGICIFSIISYHRGDVYLSSESIQKNGIEVSHLGESLGLRTGDRIVSLNGEPYERFEQLIDPKIFLEEGSWYGIMRDGERQKITIPSDFVENFSSDSFAGDFILPRTPFRVGRVLEGSAAEAAGLREGDSIISFAGQPVHYFDELRTLIRSHVQQSVVIEVLRDQEPPAQLLQLSCTLVSDTLGIMQNPQLPYAQQPYSLPQSFVAGTSQAFSLMWLNLLGIAKIVRGHISPSKSLAGPIGIAQMFGGHWEWNRFWYLVALISVFVAIFNLLPIPALDGGHVLFCLYEMISGRSLPVKFLQYTQTAGMILLVTLMVLVLFNDVWKLFT